MEFKIGDIVFLNKSSLLINDLIVNFPYIITDIHRNHICFSRIGKWYNYKNFRRYELVDGMLQGVNYFKKGDKVKLDVRGKIGWERNDYNIVNNILEDKIYTIDTYLIDFQGTKIIIMKNTIGMYHPNHFKKADNE